MCNLSLHWPCKHTSLWTNSRQGSRWLRSPDEESPENHGDHQPAMRKRKRQYFFFGRGEQKYATILERSTLIIYNNFINQLDFGVYTFISSARIAWPQQLYWKPVTCRCILSVCLSCRQVFSRMGLPIGHPAWHEAPCQIGEVFVGQGIEGVDLVHEILGGASEVVVLFFWCPKLVGCGERKHGLFEMCHPSLKHENVITVGQRIAASDFQWTVKHSKLFESKCFIIW